MSEAIISRLEFASEEAGGRSVPAWLLSAGLHAALFLTLAVTMQPAVPGAVVESSRSAGIVLVQAAPAATKYLTADDAAESAGGSSSTTAATTAAAKGATEATVESALPSAEQPPVDLAGVLPGGDDPLAGSGGGGIEIGDAGGFGSGGNTSGVAQIGGEAKTSVFGVEGTGSKFIYVFDRSSSMLGYEGRPLAAAKSELIKSLKSLASVHQFQIIFYNNHVTILNPNPSQPPRLMFGDEASKQLAERFVRGISGSGGTRHLEPLKLAIGMAPDVIFFLTDAADPELTANELSQIRRLNKGTAIHTIEFGPGPFPGGDNFLIKLARQNGGRHTYVDVSRLPVN